MLNVQINNNQDFAPISESEIEGIIREIYKAGELEESGEIDVTFLDDEEMAVLNKQYRDKEGPTDVLSFSQDEGMEFPRPDDPEYIPLIGDVIISAPTASKQAGEAGHSLMKEITILLIHGILHLYGYDHNNVYQQAFMQDEEKSILAEMLKIRNLT